MAFGIWYSGQYFIQIRAIGKIQLYSVHCSQVLETFLK